MRAWRMLATVAALLAVAAVAPLAGRASSASAGVWLAGDLHVHTIWSKDVCETPTSKNTRSDPAEPCSEPWTWGFTPAQQLERARARGLDFLVLTDHNTNAQLSDPEVAGYAGPLTLIPGTEFTLDGGEGHANLINWSAGKPADPTPADGYTAADMGSIAAGVRASGALFSINHPLNPAWGLGYPDVDAVEVWNYPWVSMTLPIIGSENTRAIAWWEDHYLATGRFPAAVGGSDNHWRTTGEVQGVGQPTTWVLAADRSLEAILDAIRAGRTTISAEPPGRGGARLFLEGDADGDGEFERTIGDAMPAGTGAFRVRALGGAGMALRLVAPGGRVVAESLVTGSDARITVSAAMASGEWLRAELFVPDLSSARAAACRSLGVNGTMDGFNTTIIDAASVVIPAATEVRPVNTGPCTIVQMQAITSPIRIS